MKKPKIIISILALLLVPLIGFAVTTIGTNIATDGNLTVNGNVTLGNASSDTVTINGAIASPLVLSQTTADYTLQWSDPTAARTLTIPDPGANDTFVFLNATQTLSNKTLTSAGNITFSGSPILTIADGGTLTVSDGTNTLFSIADAGTTGNVLISGTITGGTLTDGTLSISGGAISGATNITASGTITGGTITDGTLTITGGALSTSNDITTTATITADSGLSDGTLVISSGDISGAGDITAGGTITGGTLTDGTLSITGGNLTTSGTIDGVDVSAITAMKTSFFNTVGGSGTTVVDQFQVTANRTLTRIDFYSQTAYADGDAGDYCHIELYNGSSVIAYADVTSGSNSASWTGSVALSAGTNYQVRVTINDADATTGATAPAQGNITLHLEQK